MSRQEANQTSASIGETQATTYEMYLEPRDSESELAILRSFYRAKRRACNDPIAAIRLKGWFSNYSSR